MAAGQAGAIRPPPDSLSVVVCVDWFDVPWRASIRRWARDARGNGRRPWRRWCRRAAIIAAGPNEDAMTDISALQAFLPCATPRAWIDWALENPDLLMIDHAHCEKKAASTALNLMFRYVDRPELLDALSQLAREELLHFEQVVKMMRERGVRYDHLSPSRYAQGLRRHVRT